MQRVLLSIINFYKCLAGWLGRLALLLLLQIPLLANATQIIKVYVYHNQPPFILRISNDVHAGLSIELIEQLNSHFGPDYQFKLEQRPRLRLNHELQPWIDDQCPGKQQQCDDDWLVLWVTPQWGWGPEADTRYLWVDFFTDHDYIISSQKTPLDTWGADDMQGKIFAALRGHVYPPEINQYFKNGLLLRADSDNELTLLQRINKSRADITLMQYSTLKYLFKHNLEISQIKSELHLSAQPLKSFVLQAMIPSGRQDLQQALEHVIVQPAWSESLKKFGVE